MPPIMSFDMIAKAAGTQAGVHALLQVAAMQDRLNA
jgi:tRNA U38,U39,U40 pseudouridine synthase TruA